MLGSDSELASYLNNQVQRAVGGKQIASTIAVALVFVILGKRRCYNSFDIPLKG
jgi:hypothetical protein